MRDFSSINRIVVKVGTNLLSSSDGIDRDRIRDLCRQIAALRENGKQVILFSSGAVGLGAKALGHMTAVKHIPLKQACAAIGQPLLMHAYEEEFRSYGILCSQLLISRAVLNNRSSYNNLRSCVSTLLELGVVPIFNENDVVSTSEIGDNFGDNDRMSAYCASKIDAGLLVLLTDIDGVYTGNPRTDRDAVLIAEIDEITPAIRSYAAGKGSEFSTGGMKTKLMAAEIAGQGGCGTVIASGYMENSLLRIVEGEDIGTYIHPSERIRQHKRWIINTPAKGTIRVDMGAVKALIENHKSLLPSGIKGIDGIFREGDVVAVAGMDGRTVMKAITSFNSSDLIQIMGRPSREIGVILGKGRHTVVFRPEDTVVCNDEI